MIHLCIKAKDPKKLALDYTKLMKKVRKRLRYEREYYIKNREKLLAHHTEWRSRIRKKYLEEYGLIEAWEGNRIILAIKETPEDIIEKSEIIREMIRTKGLDEMGRIFLTEILINGLEMEDVDLPGLNSDEKMVLFEGILEKLRKNPKLKEIYEE